MKKYFKTIFGLIITLMLLLVTTSCDLSTIFQTSKHNIFFFTEQTLVYKTVETNGNEIITVEDPVKDGYTFQGWYFDRGTWENEFTSDYYQNKALEEDVRVYAYFSVGAAGVSINDYNYDTNNKTFSKTVASTITSVDFTTLVNVTNNGTYTIVGATNNTVTLNPGMNTFTIAVTNNSVTTNYTINIYRNKTYTISFVTNGGTAINPITVDEGTILTTIPESTKEGYAVKEYSYDFSKPITQDIQVNITWKKVTVYYTITFDADGGTPVSNLAVKAGSSVTSIPTSTKDGYIFDGWDVDLSQPVNSNLSVKAKWISTSQTFTVTFDTDGGSAMNPISVVYGSTVTNVATPTKSGFTFKGWDYDFTKPITKDITVKAIWNKILGNFLVTFNTNGGNTISSMSVVEGTVINAPTPTKTGYTFKGWDFDFTKPITKDVTANASWEIVKLTITYKDVVTNSTIKTASVDYNESIDLDIPTNNDSSIIFAGWKLNNNLISEYGFKTTTNVTLYATWTINNLDFENGNNPFVSYHTSSKPLGSGHTLSISTDEASSGSHSLKVVTLNHDLGSLSVSRQYADYMFSNPLTKGFTFDVYTSTITQTDGLDMRVNYSTAGPAATYRLHPMYNSYFTGKWVTYTYTREAYESYIQASPNEQYVKLIFNRYEDTYYVDNFRTLYNVSDYEVEETRYLENSTGVQEFSVNGSLISVLLNKKYFNNYTYYPTSNKITINNQYLYINGDTDLMLVTTNGVKEIAVDTIALTNTINKTVTASYGTSEYLSIDIADCNLIKSTIGDIPYEVESGIVSIPVASLIECLPEEDNKKVSGTVKLYALALSYNYIVNVSINVSSNDVVKEKTEYNADNNFTYTAYQAIPNVMLWQTNMNNITYEYLMEVKQSGITTLLPGSEACLLENDTALNAKTRTLLERCEEVGMNIIVQDNLLITLTSQETSLIGTDKRYASEQALDDAIWAHMSLYYNYDSFYGVVLRDEPKLSFLTAYTEVCRSIERLKAKYNFECFIYYNLLPMFAGPEYFSATSTVLSDRVVYYRNYVLQFINAVGNHQVTFDIYPLRQAGVSQWWILNMILLADICKQNNCTFNFTTQSCSYYTTGGTVNSRILDMEDLKYLNNTMNGFGVKNVQFYVYCQRTTIASETYLANGSFYNGDATEKNAMYYYWKYLMEEDVEFNKTLQAFDYVSSNVSDLKNGKSYLNKSTKTNMKSSSNAYYTSDYVESYDKDTYEGNLSSVYVDVDYILVNTLKNSSTGEYMYMVQNLVDPQLTSLQTITINVTNATYLDVYENGSRRVVYLNNGQATFKLSQGNAIFFIAH